MACKKRARVAGWMCCAGMIGGGAWAHTPQPQQQQQTPSHLGTVANHQGGEEANQGVGNSTNNIVPLPGEHTPVPAIRGGNGVTLSAPPDTPKHAVTETLHGQSVTDPYRWLEKQRDPQTRAWIDAQNVYTDSYLRQVTIRPQIQDELAKLVKVETYTTPVKRGDVYFFGKRGASENQFSIYMRRGVSGQDERLVEAARLGDANTSVNLVDISMDGALLVYGVRQGGADEQALHVLDVASRKDLPDVLNSARYMSTQISPDKKGVYYTVFHHEGTLVQYHAFGTPQSADKVIFGKEYKGEPLGELDLIDVSITDNQHWLILTIARGVPARREDILLMDLRRPDVTPEPLVYGIDNRFSLVDTGTDDFLVRTDMDAPRGRVLRADPKTSPKQWQVVIPEDQAAIERATVLGGRLFVERLADVKPEIRFYSLDGHPLGEVRLPGIGSAGLPYGRPLEKEGFYSFQSYNVPPTIYRYMTETNATSVFAQPKVPFHSDRYEVTQVFFTSKDGTRVPMFITGKRGMARNGKTPLLMTAYGGFNVSLTPTWNPMAAWWLEQGGWLAVPNLRGGGEYGEDWHKAGMFEHKQNVFDDFFAASRYLIDQKYTDPAHFAIEGASNGGLLMGAAITQHPEMYGAIVCAYPLLDMLRYQNFLFGRLWTTEYGSAENEKDYGYIRAYSPYQNVKNGTKYPAIMFFTGDSDTRVDPLHARKMTARMQEATGSDRPIVLHYSTTGGHSAGVSVTQQVQDESDMLAFLWNETGLR